MAVSLGFGILFTTLVCLLVLPGLYLVIKKKPIKNQANFESDNHGSAYNKVL
ncbi:MAG: hypothetical protein ACJAV1_004029 [Paraglaciecola sp.]|jgi:hypothetical protein